MKKVLLVDDESYMLDLLKQLIPWEFYGFSIVGAAENATEAMKVFHRESPDVIITDICMENISGIEFITRIRMQDTAVKVIIISAYDKFEYAQRALKLNVNGYLLKPINREELLNTLIEVQKELDSREGYQDRIQYLQESLAQLKRKYLEEQLLRLYRDETDFLPEEITGEGFWCVVSLQTIVRSEIVFIEQDIRSV
ncbi:MAG: response regulator, partial [Lachnospiraceae bacterium]|nr:response regulator [Lachnospiraceae bacterium]